MAAACSSMILWWSVRTSTQRSSRSATPRQVLADLDARDRPSGSRRSTSPAFFLPSPRRLGSNVSRWAAPPPSQSMMQASALPRSAAVAGPGRPRHGAPPGPRRPPTSAGRGGSARVAAWVPRACGGPAIREDRRRVSGQEHELGAVDQGPDDVFHPLAERRRSGGRSAGRRARAALSLLELDAWSPRGCRWFDHETRAGRGPHRGPRRDARDDAARVRVAQVGDEPGRLGVGRGPREDAEETARIRASAGWSSRQSAVMAPSSESRATRLDDDAVGQQGGLERGGRLVADGDRVLPRRPPAEGLAARRPGSGRPAATGRGGRARSTVEVNCQARRGAAQVEELRRRPAAVGVEVQLLGAERLADGREERVEQLLGRHPPPGRRRRRRRPGDDLRLVGPRAEDQPGDVLQVVVVRRPARGPGRRAARGGGVEGLSSQSSTGSTSPEPR